MVYYKYSSLKEKKIKLFNNNKISAKKLVNSSKVEKMDCLILKKIYKNSLWIPLISITLPPLIPSQNVQDRKKFIE